MKMGTTITLWGGITIGFLLGTRWAGTRHEEERGVELGPFLVRYRLLEAGREVHREVHSRECREEAEDCWQQINTFCRRSYDHPANSDMTYHTEVVGPDGETLRKWQWGVAEHRRYGG